MWNAYESDDKKPVTSVSIVISSMWCLTNRGECKKWNASADHRFPKIKNAIEFVLNKCANNNDSVLQTKLFISKKTSLYLMTID